MNSKLFSKLNVIIFIMMIMLSAMISGCGQKGSVQEIEGIEKSEATLQGTSEEGTEAGSDDHVTALMDAVSNGDTEKVKVLLSGGIDPNVKDDLGNTALMFVAQYGTTEVAQVLLNHGTDPNVKDGLGVTALMMAEENGFTDLAELLRKKRGEITEATEKVQIS